MRIKVSIFLLLLNTLTVDNSYAQVPLVYDVENTGAACTAPPLPAPNQLTSYANLPDPFAWSNGSGRITSFDDWKCRRNEIKQEIERYEIGVKPPKPGNITASYTGGTLTVRVTENGQTLTLTSNITIPAGTGPFPAIIGMNAPTGQLPANLFSGCIQIPFNHDQVVTYANGSGSINSADPYFRLYPNTNIGKYSAWSWGISRLIDGLELVQSQIKIDTRRIAVTGCSYAGKMALFGGAFDERIALTLVQESGGGGVNSWRVSETIGNVEKIDNTNYSWFMPSMKTNFQGTNVGRLPHDHHELIAMIAPRAVLILGNPPFEWLGDESGYVSSRAAQEVWKTLGVPERFGFSFRGGHDHCSLPTASNSEVTAFVDKFLRNSTSANTNIAVHSFNTTDYLKWIDAWDAYTLSPSNPNAPKVNLTSPVEGSKFEAPATINIAASVTDADNNVTKVEFFSGTQKLGEDATAPYTFSWTNVAAGNYTITAVATDASASKGTSQAIIIQVTVPKTPFNGTPHVIPGVIQAEEYDLGGEGLGFHEVNANGNEGGATFRSDQVDIEITGDANGNYNVGYILNGEWLEYTVNAGTSGLYNVSLRVAVDGANRNMHMELDGQNLTGAIAIPNTGGWQTWQTITVNNLSITAGKHALRLVFDSDYLNINYVDFQLATLPNDLPLVAIAAPVNNASYIAPASIAFTATATDADGTVSKVEFYNGTSLLGSVNTSPYTYTWTNVAAGSYAITAKATDDKGGVTTSTVITVNVVANQLPVISITAPVTNVVYTAPAASIPFAATATDADGTVSKVEFYNGTSLLGSDNTFPYTYTWINVVAGSYSITAKATDDKGAVSTSSAITVIVNLVPVISLTSPTSTESFVAPATIAINASAYDADGTISKVDFYNGTVLIGSDNSSPYSFLWTNVAEGTYTLTAIATDNMNATTTSSAITFTVNANQLPAVSITAPLANAIYTVPAPDITIHASVTDADGTISKVDFYDGATLIHTDNASPYSFNWTGAMAGTHILTVRATDDKGGVSTSAAVTLIVNHAPLVLITSPSSGAAMVSPATIIIQATASDVDGTISQVDFYHGTTLLGSDNTSPYSFIWTGVGAGDYTLTAKAVDNNNAVTTSAAIPIKVSGNQSPVIAINSPIHNATFTPNENIEIMVSAEDSDGSITKVDYFDGTSLIGTSATAPFTIIWNSSIIGAHILTAKATDSHGGVSISSPVTIILRASNQAPSVSVTSPASGTSFVHPADITINVSATDADGAISLVEFYHGSTLIGSDNSSPFSFSWMGMGVGTYIITAKATDTEGATSISPGVNISVTENQPSVITIHTPSANLIVTNNKITFDVSAQDPDGSITQVGYYSGGVLIGTSTSAPYIFEWNNPGTGAHDLSVRVTDSNGGITTSGTVRVTVNIATGILSGGYEVFTGIAPNPSSESFKLNSNRKIKTLRIANMHGREMEAWNNLEADQTTEIGRDLSEGAYLVVIEYDSGTIEVAKLVKLK